MQGLGAHMTRIVENQAEETAGHEKQPGNLLVYVWTSIGMVCRGVFNNNWAWA